MWGFQQTVRRVVAGITRRPKVQRGRSEARSTMDWLPPVLDPGDWSVAMMADRSAGWYFDRH